MKKKCAKHRSLNKIFNSLFKLMWLLHTRSSATQKSLINYTYCYHLRFGGFFINQPKHIFWLPSWLLSSLVWRAFVYVEQRNTTQLHASPGTKTFYRALTCIGIKPEDSMHHLYPTETWLEYKEGKFGAKSLNFKLYLCVLWCCSGQAAKSAVGVKLLSS